MSAPSQSTDTIPRTQWRLELLGTAKLLRNGVPLEPLEKRAAILLAYLALEGSTPRAKLAGLIWSDSTEMAARANLRQRLKRLRDALGAELIVSEEILRLRPDLEVDAVELESLTFTGEYRQAVTFEGELLAGIDSDDSPELEDWLVSTRERLTAARQEALLGEIERLESTDLTQSLELALRYQKNDPLSEEAARRVMRLHYLRGDRSSALQAFERLKNLFERDLGIAPMPQTLELLRVIERGDATPEHVPKPIQIALERPPVLVGREHEWAQLEDAWNHGKMILLTGEAGTGKSRLAMDFLASKGEATCLQARPGDAVVSYSSEARNFKQLLSRHNTQLPQWVRLELSRILPELGARPPAIQNDADQLRFNQAKTQAVHLVIQSGANLIFLDDLHFADDASQQSSLRIWGESFQNGLVKGIVAYRETELNPSTRDSLQQAIIAGHAVQIKLSPLEATEVQTMLESLGVSGLERFGANMHNATGGNPMFVLETARNLVSSGALENGDLQIPLPKSVSAAIQNRLSQLSAPAVRLARVASIAATDFTLELASRVLETHVLDLIDSITELEAAQVMLGLGFAHDLIAQTTLEGLPLSVRNLLHERIAVYLEKYEGNPARIAYHLVAAEEMVKAVPHLIKAAEFLSEQGVLKEAAIHYLQAAQFAEQFDAQKSFDLYVQTLDCMTNDDVGLRFEKSLNKLFDLAKDSRQMVIALERKAELAVLRGNYHDVIEICNKALQYVQEDTEEFANILFQKQSGFSGTGRIKEALECLIVVKKIYEKHKNEDLSVTYSEIAIIYHKLGQHRLAIDYQEKSIETEKNLIAKIRARNNYFLGVVEIGEIYKANHELLSIWNEFKDKIKETRPRIVTLTNLAVTSFYIGKMQEAFNYLEEISLETLNSQFWKTGDYHRYKGMILFELGQFELAQTHLRSALDYGLATGLKGSTWLHLARCGAQLSQDFQEALQQAKVLMVKSGDRRLIRQFHLMNAAFLTPKKALQTALGILKEAQENEIRGSEITAHTRCAQAYLQLKQAPEALEHMQLAATLLDSFDSNHLRRSEILLTYCQALRACHHPRNLEQLQKTLSWLLEIANNHVPPEYRESFLTRNPHNAAILELAKNAGLEIS